MPSANAVESVESIYEIEQLPETFEQALASGWTVLSEVTNLYPQVDKHGERRYGSVTMGLEGQPIRLKVSYSATKAGFRFDVPQIVH